MRDAGRGNVGRTARAIKSLIIPLRHFISLGRAARKVGKCGKQLLLLLLLSCCLGRRKFSPRLLQLIFLSSVFGFSFSFKGLPSVCACVCASPFARRSVDFCSAVAKKTHICCHCSIKFGNTLMPFSQTAQFHCLASFSGSFCSAANGNFLCSK